MLPTDPLQGSGTVWSHMAGLFYSGRGFLPGRRLRGRTARILPIAVIGTANDHGSYLPFAVSETQAEPEFVSPDPVGTWIKP